MHISVKCYLNIFVTEYFAERFYINACFNAARREGMAQSMKMNTLQLAGFGQLADIIAQCRRFCKARNLSRKQKSLIWQFLVELLEEGNMLCRQRNISD